MKNEEEQVGDTQALTPTATSKNEGVRHRPGATPHIDAEPKAVISYSNYTTVYSIRWFRGFIMFAVYLAVWGASIISPLIAYLMFRCHAMLGAATMVLVAAAYLCPCHLYYDGRKYLFLWCSELYQQFSLRFESFPTKEQPSIYGVHPHGIYPLGWAFLSLCPQFDHVHFAFSTVLYYTPFFRLYAHLIGRPAAVSAVAFKRMMTDRESIAIIPGGFEEATIHTNSKDRIYLKNRKGFVKYALKYGYSLTPVYSFGERVSFGNIQGFFNLRLWLNKYSIPGVLPVGRLWMPWLPYTPILHVVVGTPVIPDQSDVSAIQKGEEITSEMVDRFHQKYVDAVIALYRRNAKECYGEFYTGDLEIW